MYVKFDIYKFYHVKFAIYEVSHVNFPYIKFDICEG